AASLIETVVLDVDVPVCRNKQSNNFFFCYQSLSSTPSSIEIYSPAAIGEENDNSLIKISISLFSSFEIFSITFIECFISSLDNSPFDKGIIPVFFQQLKWYQLVLYHNFNFLIIFYNLPQV